MYMGEHVVCGGWSKWIVMGKYHNKATKSVPFRYKRRMIKILIIEWEGPFFVDGAHGSHGKS
jgi:hypothetical protein